MHPDFDEHGFRVVAGVVAPVDRDALLDAFAQLPARRAGTRDGLAHAAIRSLTDSAAVRALVEPLLGPDAVAHRATLLDKTATANWLVAWHQDLVVPVQERIDAPGFGPWSRKGGVWFVQPPWHVLRDLVAVRIDLDGSDESNGALRVLPGTHRSGVLKPDQIAESARTTAPVTCAVTPGGALVMRPLLVHASSRATRPGHRRVVHVEFAGAPLPDGLTWLGGAAGRHAATASLPGSCRTGRR
jgi:hypothetical protein